MLSAHAELGLACHIVNLLAHLVKGAIDTLPLCFDVVCNNMIDCDAGLVINGETAGQPFDQS